MKYRKDFVTNSSSSSFICEICGRNEYGMDLSLDDAEMVECVNGHTICESEMLPVGKEVLIKAILNDQEAYKQYYDEERLYTEEKLGSMSEEDIMSILYDRLGRDYMPEDMCPICQFIEYSDYDLCKYLEKQLE